MKISKMLRISAVLPACLLMLSAGMLTGCSQDSSDSSSSDISDEELFADGGAYQPKIPADKIDESIPGNDTEAKIGETVNYEDKLTVTLDQVIELDDTDKRIGRYLIAEMTIENHTDTAVDCQTLTHFYVSIDGETDRESVKDVSTWIAAKKYYNQTGIENDIFNNAIEPGATQKGYVYMAMPSAWKTAELVYTPYRYYSNDRLIFTLNEEDFVHSQVNLHVND